MNYCSNCKTSVKGDWSVCPLCGTELIYNEKIQTEKTSFLNIPLRYNRKLIKQAYFKMSLVVVFIYFIIQLFYPFRFFGLEYVLFGLLISWTMIVIFIRKRRNIAKAIVYLLLFISLFSLYFDYTNGWRGWSVTFVLPILSMSALLAIFITMQVVHLKINDYILYLQLVALFGLIPLIFLFMGWVGHPLPSLLSVIFSLAMFVGVLINYRSLLIQEIQKRMHL